MALFLSGQVGGVQDRLFGPVTLSAVDVGVKFRQEQGEGGRSSIGGRGLLIGRARLDREGEAPARPESRHGQDVVPDVTLRVRSSASRHTVDGVSFPPPTQPYSLHRTTAVFNPGNRDTMDARMSCCLVIAQADGRRTPRGSVLELSVARPVRYNGQPALLIHYL